jgi:tripartite-type tricarboxylate transporter receptor subunit TctC
MYRLVAAPPKTPADRVRLLENALMKTLEDKDFLAWAKKVKRSVYPSNGEDARRILNAQAKTYEKYREMLKKAMKK